MKLNLIVAPLAALISLLFIFSLLYAELNFEVHLTRIATLFILIYKPFIIIFTFLLSLKLSGLID
ncbi:MAG: hypothetical protein QXR82_05485 [Candidatus Bathyarchaeia archaeon]|nr:hypothetical protein [Candidatus Bathyarchaeota archaeon]